MMTARITLSKRRGRIKHAKIVYATFIGYNYCLRTPYNSYRNLAVEEDG